MNCGCASSVYSRACLTNLMHVFGSSSQVKSSQADDSKRPIILRLHISRGQFNTIHSVGIGWDARLARLKYPIEEESKRKKTVTKKKKNFFSFRCSLKSILNSPPIWCRSLVLKDGRFSVFTCLRACFE